MNEIKDRKKQLSCRPMRGAVHNAELHRAATQLSEFCFGNELTKKPEAF
jgi:hypothetical protein